MYVIVLLFLLLGVPLALFLTLLAGVSILKHRPAIGGSIVAGALIGFLTVLWEMRYDLDFMSEMLSYEQKQVDLQNVFVVLYAALIALLLFAWFRGRKGSGKGVLIILALVFWGLAAAPYVMLSPGDFAH